MKYIKIPVQENIDVFVLINIEDISSIEPLLIADSSRAPKFINDKTIINMKNISKFIAPLQVSDIEILLSNPVEV